MSELGPGARIAGRYVVEGRLGAGGMGVVLRAHDERLARSVAIKLLSSDAVGDEIARARLLREARAAAALAHPAIVHVYDVGATDDGGAFLVMELVRGKSLRGLLGAGAVPPAEAARILVEVAHALGAAHRAGFIHRDVKPDNVMIRDDGRVAILDFGLAKLTGTAASTGSAASAPLTTERGFVGTPAYMAPEQAEGGEIDGRADQFALGVMTYELLAGKLPWRGSSGLAIIAEVLQRDPPPLSRVVSGLGPDVDAAVSRAMAKQSAARFPTIEAYAAALSRALGAAPAGDQPTDTGDLLGALRGRFRALGSRGCEGAFEGEEIATGHRVEIDVLGDLSDSEASADLRTRFRSEAASLLSIDTPHVARALAAGVDEATHAPFVVVEHPGGENLQRLSERVDPLTPGVALRIAGQICVGLATIHAAGAIHGDIRPANILLTPGTGGELVVKLRGLGVSWRRAARSFAFESTGLSRMRREMGSPLFMAPEQAQGRRALDARADIWSLGVVLYRTLTGHLPHEDVDALGALIVAISSRRPSSLRELAPWVPPGVAPLVHQALEIDPDARFASAAEMLAAIRALVPEGLELREDMLVPITAGERARAPSVRPPPTPAAPIAAGTSADVALAAPSLPDPPRATTRWSRRRVAVAVGVAALASVVGIRFIADRESPVPAGTPRRLTSAPGWEAEPALSPDGNFVAYASDEKGNADIWLVDARGGAPLRLTDDPAEDRSPTWFPDGSAVAFASNRGGQWGIWKVPRLGGSATPLVANAMDPAISPDGKRIAFVRGSAAAERLVWSAPLGDVEQAKQLTTDGDGFWQNRHPAWSPDGSLIAYQDFSNVWVLPAIGSDARRLTAGSGGDGWPSWSRDGRYLYFSGFHEGTMALWRIPASGGRLTRITLGVGPEVQPSVSRDGARLAYSTYVEQPDLLVVDAHTGSHATIPSNGALLDLAISPDGHEVAYVSDRQGGRGLWLQTMIGLEARGEPRRVTELPGGIARPAYSPDGRWIAVHRVVDGQRDIWILPAAGGMPLQITDDPGVDVQPAWSANGSQIAFVSDRSGQRQVWTVPIHEGRPTGAPRQVTTDGGPKSMPTWSPDDARIAYLADVNGVSEVWVISSAGNGSPKRVTTGAQAYSARWGQTSLLVSGTWGRRLMTLARVSIETGLPAPFEPEVGFGNGDSALFDASRDGRMLVVDHETVRGDIWVLDAPSGSMY